VTAAATGLALQPSVVGASSVAPKGLSPACTLITQRQVVAAGFSRATAPKITPFNSKNIGANPANSLGETIDFGARALVVGCASPADLRALSSASAGKSTPTMSASQYVEYLVKTSAGAMKSERIGGVAGFIDYGNGKEDGLGSTSTAGSVRLDTFAAGGYVINFFSSPISSTTTKRVNALARAIVTDLAHA
jgi:hypothetical protein